MSGLAKGIGKVFRAVGKVIKKLAPVILIAGIGMLTGGFGLAGAGAAGAGVAGTGASVAGASGAATGGFGSWLSSLFGGGGAAPALAATKAATAAGGGFASSFLGKALASPLVGSVIAGAAKGAGAQATKQAEEQSRIDEENRLQANYAGSGDASSPTFNNIGSNETGIGSMLASASLPLSADSQIFNASVARPRLTRPPIASAQRTAERMQYDPTTGRIVTV